MAVSKIVYDGRALIDLTADTVTADALLSGTTAHDKAGNAITGSGAPDASLGADGDIYLDLG